MDDKFPQDSFSAHVGCDLEIPYIPDGCFLAIEINPSENTRHRTHNSATRFHHKNLIGLSLKFIEGKKAGFSFLVKADRPQDGAVSREL
jgi:hypothetical protein